MPITGNSTYALVIVSLGILGVVVSFLIVDRKKYITALCLSLLVVGMGMFQFVGSSVSRWRTARRIAKLQETQRLSLESLQSRLREATEKGRKTASPAPSAPAPAAPAEPPKKKK